LNVHASKEDKIHDVKDSFHGELEPVFDKFPKISIEYVVRRLKSQSRQGRQFKTKNWE
jgi:hypothetical protein